MRYIVLVIGIAGGLWVVSSLSGQNQSEPATQSTAPDTSADEDAIRANVEKFEKAYNAGDAKAIAALFTKDGQIVDKDGDEHQGRHEIEKAFSDLFAASPDKKIDIVVESIRFIGSNLAIETGTTKEILAPGEPPDDDRYTVIHVKRDGKWQMALARDEEGPPPTGREQLQPLAWLIGDWVDDDGSTVVNSSCRWSDDGKFLLQEFKLQLQGRDAMNVSQRIGWDPVAKQIRSWVFDSEGGFGESLWTRDGDNWMIRANGVRPDGTTASATNFLIPSGKDGYVFRSTNRIVADEPEANMEVKVVRKPPQPEK
jgi:uncharacterized protein (TIGR02246 family)